MSENVRELSPEQHQAIELLVSGSKRSDIAAALGIDLRTLYRWRQLPAFAEHLRELQQQRHDYVHERFSEILRLASVSLARELKKAEDPKLYNPLETAIHAIKLLYVAPEMAPR